MHETRDRDHRLHGPDPRHGWLAAVVPAAVRRVRTRDAALARTLLDAGFELVDDDADAELGQAGELSGHAPFAVVALQPAEPGGRVRALRGLRRARSAARVRLAARAARRRLRRLGYQHVEVLAWERGDSLDGSSAGGALSHRLPLNTLVAGSRGRPGPTILEAAAAAAGRAAGVDLPQSAPVVGSSGVALVVGETAVLRVALGTPRQGLEAHVRALERLGGAGVDRLVGARLPSVLASGREGSAGWAVETRLPGAPPGVPVDDALARDCVDFLVALHATGGMGGPTWRAASCAAELAPLTGGDTRTALDELSARADRALDALPRGPAHGDFWAGNLLVAGGRLEGVVDWAGAGGGRPPLLDLLQLRVADLREAHGLDLGPALLRFAALRNPTDDAAIRDYADRLGLELGQPEWHALLVAFWLDALSRALRDPDPLVRPADSAWREANVERVIGELGARAAD
jgi:aminoglycoside phosphotransferase (APT) family kinase protein